jgi:malate dehydrogenase (oxaloacetate-decarboxylating)(NADP+)
MVQKGYADAIICGTIGNYQNHMKHVVDIIGLQPGVESPAALSALIMNKGTYFITDTHVNPDPSIAQISEMTLMAAEVVHRFGIKPKVALLSHSNFGTHENGSAFKMQAALADIRLRAPDLEIDGEMNADAALSQTIREVVMPNSTLSGEANVFVMPNVDAANIAFNMLKVLGDAISIGPMLLGMEKPAHIVSTSITPRGIVNVTAVASVEAQIYQAEHKTDQTRQAAMNV